MYAGMKPVRPKTPKRTIPKLRASVKDPIVVYCRIRPIDSPLDSVCIRSEDDKTVALFKPTSKITCSFQHVFNESTSQKELFDQVAYPLVQDVLNGFNGLLFTYGITSSGKTYTMTGTPHDGGLVPRSLDVIFNSIKDYQTSKFVFKPDKFNAFDIRSTTEALLEQQKELGAFTRTPKPKRKENSADWSNRVSESAIVDNFSADMNYAVFVTYIEIYNNYIYDLLEEDLFDRRLKTAFSKALRQDTAGNVFVFDAVEKEVKSAEEALDLFYQGQKKRKVGSTALNTESSRSHSVFTIRIVAAPLDNLGADIIRDKKQIIISQLSLVDLAGSERVARTRNTNKKLGEAGNINNSLMVLKTCIEALRENQNQGAVKMVPYRESKVTHLFKTFFEGEGKIRMIVCVNPKSDNYDEMTHVLKFAEMTQEVQIQRPTPVSTPNILGFKVGRGNLYREAYKKSQEQGVPISELIVPTMYSLGPAFPPLVFDIDDETAFAHLIDYLNERRNRRDALERDLIRKQEEFRTHLVGMDMENSHLKLENDRIQKSLQFREQQIQAMERRLGAIEEASDNLKRQLVEAQNQTEKDKWEIRNKNKRISELSKEMGDNKMRMEDKLASERAHLRRLVERRLAAKQAELEQKMCFTQEKFRQLYKILNADDWDMLADNGPPSPPTSTANSDASTPEPRRSKRKSAGDPCETEVKFLKARSAVDIMHSRRNTPQSSQPTSSGNDFDYLYAKENKAPSSSQRSLAIANLRHRRSQSSSGDVWVEHKPIGNLELNTVLQPKMKKKKSVTQLNVKDVVNKDSSRYLLQHQEQDSQGDVVTEMYKGDIIPSAGGGAQVVFSDVEKLKQTSPTGYNLRKRSGDLALPLKEIEERCATSIECHGLASKQQKKK